MDERWRPGRERSRPKPHVCIDKAAEWLITARLNEQEACDFRSLQLTCSWRCIACPRCFRAGQRRSDGTVAFGVGLRRFAGPLSICFTNRKRTENDGRYSGSSVPHVKCYKINARHDEQLACDAGGPHHGGKGNDL